MKESTINKIEILLVFLLIIGALLFKFIPEYQNSQGSSDAYIDSTSFDDIIEIKVNDKPNFAIVTSDNSIIGILFFDKESLCIYNQNIENMTIEDGMNNIVELLIENNYLKSNSAITFIKYSNASYEKVTNAFKNTLLNLKVEVNYIEMETTLQERSISLDITETDVEQIMKELDLYSKDIIRHNKNNVSESSTSTPAEMSEITSKEYANNVYIKIENYIEDNNIVNQEVTNTSLPIYLIPANSQGTVFPDTSSWYYIKDSKVYAYISITHNNKTYSYCYQGSIDEYKKGQC